MKKLPESTYEILLHKHLNNPVDELWINWAYEMLVAGYENEYIIILAGETKPYNQFELNELTNKVFDSLEFDFSNEEIIWKNYLTFISNKILNEEYLMYSEMKELSILYTNLDNINILNDIALLYWAKSDLEYDTIQHYWSGANRENIDEICINYFKEWVDKNEYIDPKKR